MFTIHGHELAVRLLQDGLRQGRLHHAYLLAGPAHVGKTTLATQLAQVLNCTGDKPPCGSCNSCLRIAAGQHADVMTIGLDAEGEDVRTMIGIDAVRDLQSSAHLMPYEGKVRVFIFQDAERLSAEAANALLKVLEEPPPNVVLLLLTADPEALLPTIASRCQLIEMRPLSAERLAAVLREEHGVAEEEAAHLAGLSRGCVGWAIQAVETPSVMAALHQHLERIADVCGAGLEGRFAYADDLARRYQRDRQAGREELSLWLRWWRDILLLQQGRGDDIVHRSWRGTLEALAASVTVRSSVAFIGRVYETLEALERNANPRLALEALMLDLSQGAGAGAKV